LDLTCGKIEWYEEILRTTTSFRLQCGREITVLQRRENKTIFKGFNVSYVLQRGYLTCDRGWRHQSTAM